MKRRSFRVALSFAVSALFLGLAVRGVDWNEAAKALASAKYIAVVPTLVLTIWSLYVRAQRWRLLLRPVGHPSMRTLVAATNIGFMSNMILPLRIGEVIRPVLASRRERLPMSGVIATVVLERIFDLFTVLFMFGIAVSFVAVSDEVRGWGYAATAFALLVGGTVALIRWQEARMLAIARWIVRRMPTRAREPMEQFIVGFLRALEVLDSPGTFLLAFLWSFFMWAVIAATNVSVFFAFGLPVPVILGAVTVTSIVAIAVSVPSAPGFIGSFQLGCILSLALFNIDKSTAIAYSIVLHATQFVGVVGAGVYSLWTEGMSFSDVEKASEQPNVAA